MIGNGTRTAQHHPAWSISPPPSTRYCAYCHMCSKHLTRPIPRSQVAGLSKHAARLQGPGLRQAGGGSRVRAPRPQQLRQLQSQDAADSEHQQAVSGAGLNDKCVFHALIVQKFLTIFSASPCTPASSPTYILSVRARHRPPAPAIELRPSPHRCSLPRLALLQVSYPLLEQSTPEGGGRDIILAETSMPGARQTANRPS